MKQIRGRTSVRLSFEQKKDIFHLSEREEERRQGRREKRRQEERGRNKGREEGK